MVIGQLSVKYPRAFLRITLLLGILFVGVLIVVILAFKVKRGIPDQGFQKVSRRWFAAIAWILGIKVKTFGTAKDQPALWVSNHISWSDILVIGAHSQVGFLSKKEVQSWPVIGWVVAHGGTLFIDRGTKNAADNAAKEITRHVQHGHSILVFPEGTTGDGEDLRRFHARIFAPVLDNQLLVQPVALKYVDPQGKPSREVKFVDDMGILDRARNVLLAKNIHVELHFLPSVNGTDFSARKALAQDLQASIGEVVRS